LTANHHARSWQTGKTQAHSLRIGYKTHPRITDIYSEQLHQLQKKFVLLFLIAARTDGAF